MYQTTEKGMAAGSLSEETIVAMEGVLAESFQVFPLYTEIASWRGQLAKGIIKVKRSGNVTALTDVLDEMVANPSEQVFDRLRDMLGKVGLTELPEATQEKLQKAIGACCDLAVASFPEAIVDKVASAVQEVIESTDFDVGVACPATQWLQNLVDARSLLQAITSLKARATEDDEFNAELCLQFGSEVATMQLLLLRVGDAAKELQEAGGATHVRTHMQKVFDDKATNPQRP